MDDVEWQISLSTIVKIKVLVPTTQKSSARSWSNKILMIQRNNVVYKHGFRVRPRPMSVILIYPQD